MKKLFILHPFLIAAYCVLLPYNTNVGRFEIEEMLPYMLVSLCLSALLFLIIKNFLKNPERAGISVSIILIAFFSFGHSINMVEKLFVFQNNLPLFLIYSIIYLSIFVVLIAMVIKSKKDQKTLNRFLNLSSIFLVLILSSQITAYKIKYPKTYFRQIEDTVKKVRFNHVPRPNAGLKMPDIYYLILDGYTSFDALKKYYDFPNSDFHNFLKEKGFYVANSSRSNYAWTYLSLASSMNMEYINFLGEKLGTVGPVTKVPAEMIYNSRVIQFLKSWGYRIVYYGCGYEHLKFNPGADENLTDSTLMPGEFAKVIAQTSLFRILLSIPSIGDFINDNKRNLVPKTYALLEGKIAKDGPKFVMAHVLSPHPPFRFDKKGNRVKGASDSAQVWSPARSYINEMIYLNKLVSSFIDKLLKQSPVPPIIILQGDHGSFLGVESPDKDKIPRTSILNAYYLPGKCTKMLYKNITPVNSFRVMFNCTSNSNYPLLKDETFWSSKNRFYDFERITDSK